MARIQGRNKEANLLPREKQETLAVNVFCTLRWETPGTEATLAIAFI